MRKRVISTAIPPDTHDLMVTTCEMEGRSTSVHAAAGVKLITRLSPEARNAVFGLEVMLNDDEKNQVMEALSQKILELCGAAVKARTEKAMKSGSRSIRSIAERVA